MLKESISRWQELVHVKMIRHDDLPRAICILAEGCALSKGWLRVPSSSPGVSNPWAVDQYRFEAC